MKKKKVQTQTEAQKRVLRRMKALMGEIRKLQSQYAAARGEKVRGR